jgi:NDMA-dependent alcohol dehydrogenase
VRTRAALLFEQPGTWQVTDVELDDPGPGEVLIELAATGLCHSDDHFATGDLPAASLPLCNGHEGSGVVRAVGPGVTQLTCGDHVVTSFIPSCGSCRWCVSGMQNLCDNGQHIRLGTQLDGSYRMHYQDADVPTAAMLGTFSELQVVDVASCIRIPADIPLDVACLVGCGVPTGWGSAVHAAAAQPGDVVIVMGVGGVGMNAVQGAHHCSASHVIAVDPVMSKREASIKFGATEAFSTMEEAADFARSVTNGQGADAAIVTVGVLQSKHIAEAFSSVRKAGVAVLTAQGAQSNVGIPVSLFEMSMYQKRIQGALYGAGSPRREVYRLLDLYRSGHLLLEELITRRYKLDDIGEARNDLHSGRNIRGVIELNSAL